METHKAPEDSPSPLPPYYDLAEIDAALNALTNAEIRRMVAFAQRKFVGVTGRNGDTDAEDLFSLAAFSTLCFARKWKRGVSLFNHFVAAMRSIADHRFKDAARWSSIYENMPAPVQLAAADAEESVAKLEQALEGDLIALKVLETLSSKTPARDAQKQLGISEEVYNAARKRIRRRAEACKTFGNEVAHARKI